MQNSAFDPAKEVNEKKRDVKGKNKENIKSAKLEMKLSNDKENERKTRSGKESVKGIQKEESVADMRKLRE